MILFTLAIILSISMVRAPTTVKAQDAAKLKYGDTAQGEVSDETFEVQFKFSGKKGDLVAAQMRPIRDKDYKTVSSVVLILDAKNKVLIDTSKIFGASGGSSLAIAELKADGDYTIIATRYNGRSGDSSGKFNLDLMKVPALGLGKAVTGTATREGASHSSALYSIVSKDDFALTFTKTDGDLNPELSVYELQDAGELKRVGVASGSSVLAMTLAIAGGNSTYLVSIDDADGFYADDKSTANFKIQADKYPAAQ